MGKSDDADELVSVIYEIGLEKGWDVGEHAGDAVICAEIVWEVWSLHIEADDLLL